MEDEIELIDYLKVLWKRKILIVAGTLICVLAAGAKIYFISPTPPLYTASVKILLRQPNFQNIFGQWINEDLHQTEKPNTYVELFKIRKTVEKVLKTLQLDKNQYNLAVDDIQRMGELKLIQGTNIMRLSVSFENPEIAAEIANIWAREFLKYFSATLLNRARDLSLSELMPELNRKKQRLEVDEKKLKLIRKKINQHPSNNTEGQNLLRARLIDQELQAELTILSLKDAISSLEDNTKKIKHLGEEIKMEGESGIPSIGEIIEEATISESTSKQNKRKLLMIAFVAGLFLSIFVAFFTEYIQNAIAKQKA